MNYETLVEGLMRCASRQTSLSEEGWTADNPLYGHCAVVALLAQDYFEGELLRASLEGTPWAAMRSHYWNLLPDGEHDFTEAQFKGNRPALTGEKRTREYVVGNKNTLERYLLLKRRLELLLEDSSQ